jgi:hypothetical protein
MKLATWNIKYGLGVDGRIDQVSGQTQLMFAFPFEVAQHVSTGRLRVLAPAGTPAEVVSLAARSTIRRSAIALRPWARKSCSSRVRNSAGSFGRTSRAGRRWSSRPVRKLTKDKRAGNQLP